jgi:cytochrome c-type biogenesis protein CcmH/NrfG
VLKAYAASLLGPDHPESGAPEVGDDAEGVYRRIAELDPSDPEPHWYLGLAALQDGDRPRAADHWRYVLTRLTPDHPDYAAIQQG